MGIESLHPLVYRFTGLLRLGRWPSTSHIFRVSCEVAPEKQPPVVKADNNVEPLAMVLVYRRSISALTIAIPVVLATIGLGVYGLLRGHVLLGCLIPFGGALLTGAVIYGLLDNAPRVILDREGISAREWGWIKIRWEDIRDVNVIGSRTGTTVTLAVRDTDKYTAQLASFDRLGRQVSRRFNGEPFSFNSTALAASNGQIMADIRTYMSASQSITQTPDVPPPTEPEPAVSC